MIPPQKPQTQIQLERAPTDTPWAVRVHPSLGCPAQALERDYWISAYGGPGQLRPPSGTCSPGRHSEQETSTASPGEVDSADKAEWGALHRLPAALGMEPTWRQGGCLPSLDCCSHKTEHPFNSEASWRSALLPATQQP